MQIKIFFYRRAAEYTYAYTARRLKSRVLLNLLGDIPSYTSMLPIISREPIRGGYSVRSFYSKLKIINLNVFG